eukprot:TRINITY_DN387_c0_g1_i2.p1 TRINITY_DN387_c0_g1~~TRINITY_DN387_c0_g1_i2.p1  ORF type:complete len:227 (-),score=37.35 TRINITY_DN387_c0_g1_i2:270-950(-)
MGKTQQSPSPPAGQSQLITKVKKCHSCGAEYARKGTLCGSCRGIRHRLLKKERERKTSGRSIEFEDTLLHIPVPARSKEAREKLTSSSSSLTSSTSSLPSPSCFHESDFSSAGEVSSAFDCKRCSSLSIELRRTSLEKQELQRQLADMEIEVHALRLNLMNALQSGKQEQQRPEPPTRQFEILQPIAQHHPSFCFAPQTHDLQQYAEVSLPSLRESSLVSVCHLVN